jgi:hypothetical protein
MGLEPQSAERIGFTSREGYPGLTWPATGPGAAPVRPPAMLPGMRSPSARAALLLALLAAAPVRAAAFDDLDGAPTPWPAEDRAAFTRSCATLRLSRALCECFLGELQPHFASYDAFQRNRDPAKDRAAELGLQRCASQHRAR